jgi:hypothetical protein
MGRTIAGVVAGIAGWIVIATILNFGLRAFLPGYHAAEPIMAFTLTMKLARLTIGALTSLAAGALVRAIAPASRVAPWITGVVMLALALPDHILIWDKFPVWYHLTFLITLVPLVVLGARLARRS